MILVIISRGRFPTHGSGNVRRRVWTNVLQIGASKNTVRRYCLDIPRFEESLNN